MMLKEGWDVRNVTTIVVDRIEAEGVVLERKPMGEGTGLKTPLVTK